MRVCGFVWGGCGAVVMYCVPVHVFMHVASKQPGKRKNENKSTGKDDRCAYECI